MQKNQFQTTLYRTPLSPAYWNKSSMAMRNLKLQIFAAMMIAVTRALSLVPGIPIWHTKLTWGFLARSVCALVCGPVLGLVFGFAEDILGFVLQPAGEFFPGYTLSTMAGVLIYALFFFRRRTTVANLVLANLAVNFLVNAAMGALWSTMIRGGGYLVWFLPSLAKNLITVIPKSVAMYVLFRALLPVLAQMGLIPDQTGGRIRAI